VSWQPRSEPCFLGGLGAGKVGLEGIVSKRRDAPYRSGRSPHWHKVKNPDSPAAKRIME
jgi:hypothetical protein